MNRSIIYHVLICTALLLTILSILFGTSAAFRSASSDNKLFIKDEARRQIYNINENWLYLEDNLKDIALLDQSKAHWEKINLPHTWNLWDVVDPMPGYRRDASWYKKELAVPVCKNNLRFILCFEGVNITSDVFVNGKWAGGHVGGYIGFDVDITKYLIFGQTNTVLVRASNEHNTMIIPSQKSVDFTIYGGITRDVWLKVVPDISISKVKIRTPNVSKNSAKVEVEVLLTNESGKEESCNVQVILKSRKGKQISVKSVSTTATTGQSSIRVMLSKVQNPDLWSPENPTLYTVTAHLMKKSVAIDEVSDRFGFRWFEFKDHGPFFLNGKRLLLRGTSRHEDFAGYGNAMPDSLHRQDMKMIKEVGANFVRLAHYPQDPEVYRACDELGLLVWDELPWCRGGVGPEEWKQNTRRLLKEQIEQNFNHPSIIIHSLGNEMFMTPDFPNGNNTDSLRAMIKELNTISHQLDPYRVTCTRKFTEGADLVDIVSPSIWEGWYKGSYKGYEKALMDAHGKLARFFHAEYGGESHFGRHTENPTSGDATKTYDGWENNSKSQIVNNIPQMSDWSETYIVNLFDWYLHITEQSKWLTGNAQWAFKDFPSPLRQKNPIPYVNQKGLVDRAGVPKDAYYVFKSYWTESPKFCYIESHTWDERSGSPLLKRTVRVYSNCSEAELFLNGVSLGRNIRNIKNYPACGLRWDVLFKEGDNALKVIGYEKQKRIAVDSMHVTYFYTKNARPVQIQMRGVTLTNGNILITAIAVDRNGRRCLDYNKRIYFSFKGVGELLANYGTPTRSSIIEMANGKAQIEFKPVPKQRAVIEVHNEEFKSTFLKVNE
jgi:beta-galactosidase